MSSDDNLGKPIVVDFGSGTIKIGFCGDPTPKFIIPNLFGIPKFPRTLVSTVDHNTYIGSQVDELRGLLDLFHTMENGAVIDMDRMYKMWSYILGPSVLNVDPRNHPILVTEPVLSSYKTKKAIAQHLFEALSVPAICFACAPVLSLYGNGFHTGCVLESGEGVTSTICVCEGYSLVHSSKRTNVSGGTVSDFLQKNLFREGHYFSGRSSYHTINDMKRSICQVSPISYNNDILNDYSASVPYSLPDGTTINIGRSRMLAPEVLFRPVLIGDESSGFHQLVYDSIRTVDHEVRKKLYKNIVLSGGNTLFQGTETRLMYELKLLTGNQCNIKIHSPKNKITAAFKGGSMICMLDSFRGMWTTKIDYAEKRKI